MGGWRSVHSQPWPGPHVVLRCPVMPTLLQGSGVLMAATTHMWPLGFWLGLVRIKSAACLCCTWAEHPRPLAHSILPSRESLGSSFTGLQGSGHFMAGCLCGWVIAPKHSIVLTLYLKSHVLEKVACVAFLCKKCGLRAVCGWSQHSRPLCPQHQGCHSWWSPCSGTTRPTWMSTARVSTVMLGGPSNPDCPAGGRQGPWLLGSSESELPLLPQAPPLRSPVQPWGSGPRHLSCGRVLRGWPVLVNRWPGIPMSGVCSEI